MRACRRVATFIAETWIGVNVLGLKVGGRMVWQVTEPAGLRHDAWYVIACNHRSWVDIFIVQWLFNRRLPMLKFFLKKELFWVPLLGLAWWALEFPFMQRYPRALLEKRPELRRKDLERRARPARAAMAVRPLSPLSPIPRTRQRGLPKKAPSPAPSATTRTRKKTPHRDQTILLHRRLTGKYARSVATRPGE